jgi:hypothetical protein
MPELETWDVTKREKKAKILQPLRFATVAQDDK